MNSKELNMAFSLLHALYPRAHQFTDKNVMLAWGMELKRYDYDMFRDLARAQALRLDRPPELRDITRGLDRMLEEDFLDYLRDFVMRDILERRVRDAVNILRGPPGPEQDALIQTLREPTEPLWKTMAEMLQTATDPEVAALGRLLRPPDQPQTSNAKETDHEQTQPPLL